MIPVLELKLELLSTNRWRITDSGGLWTEAPKVRDVSDALARLLEQRARLDPSQDIPERAASLEGSTTT